MKHIYKHSIEAAFFKLLNSKNGITKETIDGKPAIAWRENDTTTSSWSYDGGIEGERQRDNDFDVITHTIMS
jgi:hypothetical protein